MRSKYETPHHNCFHPELLNLSLWADIILAFYFQPSNQAFTSASTAHKPGLHVFAVASWHLLCRLPSIFDQCDYCTTPSLRDAPCVTLGCSALCCAAPCYAGMLYSATKLLALPILLAQHCSLLGIDSKSAQSHLHCCKHPNQTTKTVLLLYGHNLPDHHPPHW